MNIVMQTPQRKAPGQEVIQLEPLHHHVSCEHWCQQYVFHYFDKKKHNIFPETNASWKSFHSVPWLGKSVRNLILQDSPSVAPRAARFWFPFSKVCQIALWKFCHMKTKVIVSATRLQICWNDQEISPEKASVSQFPTSPNNFPFSGSMDVLCFWFFF